MLLGNSMQQRCLQYITKSSNSFKSSSISPSSSSLLKQQQLSSTICRRTICTTQSSSSLSPGIKCLYHKQQMRLLPLSKPRGMDTSGRWVGGRRIQQQQHLTLMRRTFSSTAVRGHGHVHKPAPGEEYVLSYSLFSTHIHTHLLSHCHYGGLFQKKVESCCVRYEFFLYYTILHLQGLGFFWISLTDDSIG